MAKCEILAIIFLVMYSKFVRAIESAEGKRGCVTRLDIKPKGSTRTASSVKATDPLRVTCITQPYPSHSYYLLSLTLGVITLQSSEIRTKPKGSDRTHSATNMTQVFNSTHLINTTTQQAFKSSQVDKETENSDFKNSANNKDTKLGPQLLTHTALVQLVPVNATREGFDRFLPRIRMSAAFKNKNISSFVEVPENGIGLVLLFQQSALTCSLSPYAFFCSALTCQHWLNSCQARQIETTTSPPLFIQGCKSPPPSTEWTTSRCSYSTDFTLADENRNDSNQNSPTTFKGSIENRGNGYGMSGTNSSSANYSKLEQDDDLCNGNNRSCLHRCGHCLGGSTSSTCKHGECTGGCEPGYVGRSCNETCPSGWFGIRCSSQCQCSPLCDCAVSDGQCHCAASQKCGVGN